MRTRLGVLVLLAAAATVYGQAVGIKNIGVGLGKYPPSGEMLAVHIGEDGNGSVTVNEPGSYELKFEQKGPVAIPYVLEASVTTESPVTLGKSMPASISSIRMFEAPKVLTMEVLKPGALATHRLEIAKADTVLKLKLAARPAPSLNSEGTPARAPVQR